MSPIRTSKARVLGTQETETELPIPPPGVSRWPADSHRTSQQKSSAARARAGTRRAARSADSAPARAAARAAESEVSSSGPRETPSSLLGKPKGTRTTRRILSGMVKRILQLCGDAPRSGAARITGLSDSDVKNLRAGNAPGLAKVLRIITKGRYSPEFLFYGKSPRKLRSDVSTRLAQPRLVRSRIRRLAREGNVHDLARATGLSWWTIYSHRLRNSTPGLHAALAYLQTGISARELLLGISGPGANKS